MTWSVFSVYTGLPFDVPIQYVVASPPGSYYPYVFVTQATPTVTVQQSSSSNGHGGGGQQNVVDSDQQQQQNKEDKVVD